MNPDQKLREAMAPNPIGTPVAMRLNITSAAEAAISTASAVAFAASVFASEPIRLGCRSDVETGYTTSLVEYSEGQTASINVICRPNHVPAIELMLIGNQRTLQLDLEDCDVELVEPNSSVIAAVERACKSDNTIELSGE